MRYVHFPASKLIGFKKNHDVTVIHRVNDNGSHRKNDLARDERIMSFNENVADRTVFISSWLQTYFECQDMYIRNSVVINNGVDRQLFSSSDIIRSRNTPLKIVSHHWSDNVAKGYDIYEHISKFCKNNPEVAQFRFFGKAPNGYLNDCEKLPPKFYQEVPDYLMDQDIYVTATKFESGGCHIVEGMACGLIPLVESFSGGPMNYAGKFAVPYRGHQVIDAILEMYDNYDLFIQRKTDVMIKYTYSYEDMGDAYMKIINGEI